MHGLSLSLSLSSFVVFTTSSVGIIHRESLPLFYTRHLDGLWTKCKSSIPKGAQESPHPPTRCYYPKGHVPRMASHGTKYKGYQEKDNPSIVRTK